MEQDVYIYGIRTYHIYIYIDNFPFTPQVWGSLRSPQLLCVVRRAAYLKLIQFSARNVHKIRIVQTPRVLQWSRTAILQQESTSHQGIEKTDCSVEESERELVVLLKLRNRERNGWECGEQEIGLDAPLRLPKRETPDCGKYAITDVVRSLKDDNTSLKAVQKLLINSVGERLLSSRNLPSAPPATNVQSIPTLYHAQPRWISCSGKSGGWRPCSLQLLCQHLTTTLVVPPPLSLMRWHCYTTFSSSPCPSNWVQTHLG